MNYALYKRLLIYSIVVIPELILYNLTNLAKPNLTNYIVNRK